MKISEEVIKVLDALCEKFGIAIDWTQENVLPYIESLGAKLITWEIATSIFWICLMLFITLIFFFVCKKVNNKYIEVFNADDTYEEEKWCIANIFSWVFFAIMTVATVIVIGIQIYDIVTCLSFPEMAIFNTIKSLMPANN